MGFSICEIDDAVWSAIESHFVPLPEGSDESRVWHYLPLVGLLPVGLCTLCVDLAYRLCAYTASWFSPWYWAGCVDGNPKDDFSCVLRDSRNWQKLGDLEPQITLGQNNPDFQWGVATCTFQDSGAVNCPHSQWAQWEKTCIPDENNRSGRSANFLELYKTPEGRKEITDRLHLLGVNTYRFSLAWSEIEPEEGVYNEEMIQMWVDLCKHLRQEGINPMITLHHFSEPNWFHEKGSFEKEENLVHFQRFVEKVGPYLVQPFQGKPLVSHICTINEPGIDAFSRYIRGAFSPGVTFDFARGGQFMKTAIKAHTLAYEQLKKMNPEVQVGIVHQRLSFNATNILVTPLLRWLSRFVNETVMNCFKTGDFELKIPFFCNIQEKGLQPKTDFVGLQYYVRPLIGFTGSTSYHEPMTQMPFREDPEGIYEAILEVHEAFRAPVRVTENGISTKYPEQRDRYNQRAIYAVQRAQEVIGEENLLAYFSWSFTDNSEWDMAYSQQFGAYELQADGKLAQTPKEGMESFMKAIRVWRAAFAAQAI